MIARVILAIHSLLALHLPATGSGVMEGANAASRPDGVVKRDSRPLTEADFQGVMTIMEAQRIRDQDRVLAVMRERKIDALALQDLLTTISLTLRYVEAEDGLLLLGKSNPRLSPDDRAKLERASVVAKKRLSTYFAERGGNSAMEDAVTRVRSNVDRIRKVIDSSSAPSEESKR